MRIHLYFLKSSWMETWIPPFVTVWFVPIMKVSLIICDRQYIVLGGSFTHPQKMWRQFSPTVILFDCQSEWLSIWLAFRQSEFLSDYVSNSKYEELVRYPGWGVCSPVHIWYTGRNACHLLMLRCHYPFTENHWYMSCFPRQNILDCGY